MPVRRTIHSSLVSRRASRSWFVTTRSGSAAPTPNRPARTPRRGRRRGPGRGVAAGRRGAVLSTVAAMSGRLERSLDEAGEHGAGAELDEALDAGRAHGEERLAPADGAQQVLGQLAAHVAERGGAAVGVDREARRRHRGGLERGAQPLGGGLNERRVEGAADVQAPGAGALFFNDTAPTEIYPLSLHDELRII